MKEFKTIPIGSNSKGKRSLIFGVGIVDVNYKVIYRDDGKVYQCPFYASWKSMLTRCYSSKSINKNSTYKNCYVCDEWLSLSNFKKWMTKQDWKNKDLDKDIVLTGNKIYSPITCIFVSHRVNSLLNNQEKNRGKFSQGVTLNKRSKKFFVRCRSHNKVNQLGTFKLETDASNAYKKFKSALILKIASEQEQPLKGYLTRIANEYLA